MKPLIIYIFIIAIVANSPGQDAGMGGAATGTARIYNSRRTSGITELNAPIIFEDITSRTALSKYRCTSGGREKHYLIESTACTVAIFDYDDDGKPDIYLLNGSTIAAELGKEKAPSSALFRNLGNWKFEDVTESAGVGNGRWGMGVTVGDYNNDGRPDLFVSNYGKCRLYRNNGDGTFTDIASSVGINTPSWHTGPTFGDYDQDGRLDIFIPAYIEMDMLKLPASLASFRKARTGGEFCQFRGEPVMCGPRGMKGAKDILYHQRPDGTFEDAGSRAGVIDRENDYGFSSVFIDVDDDHDPDLIVVNDSTPNRLYLNKGSGIFDEVGTSAGIAYNENGREQAGMGLGIGDYDNDGRVDLYVTNFSDDSNTLYHNDGEAGFTDVTYQSGLGEPTIPFLGWGTAFLDYDNDGWKDILVANGHVYPEVDNFQWGTSYAQQILLFKNIPDPRKRRIRFERVPAAANSGLALSLPARGMATGDLDGDGCLDVIVANSGGPPAVLRNVVRSKNNWLDIKLVGDVSVKTPRDAIGSVIFATIGGLRRRFDVTSGANYASQDDQTVHIGLGTKTEIERLEIIWANGQKEVFSVGTINQKLTIKQNTGSK
jgi:hypothetical protein